MPTLDRAMSSPPLWGKLERTDAAAGLGWHSLVDHSADVAACMEGMLKLPVVQRRLARLAGVETLPAVWLARIAAHTFLRDLGKANRGFRKRLRKDAAQVGHIREAVALLLAKSLHVRLSTALPIEQMKQWGSFEEAFLSIVAHHGRPVDINNIFPDDYRDRWIAGGDCDPVADLAVLGAAVRRWYPEAFAEAGVSLPSRPRFWHAIAGYAMLADWLGSDTDIFPFANGDDPDRMQFARHQSLRALRDLGIDPSEVRMTGVPTFASVSRYPTARNTDSCWRSGRADRHYGVRDGVRQDRGCTLSFRPPV
jgi:CRISPR-associated endonuclease/helicase Cas3